MLLYFDMFAIRMVETKREKQVCVLSASQERRRVTVMVCCTAHGRKLPPYPAFKRKTLLKGVE